MGLTAVLDDNFFGHEYAVYALVRQAGSPPGGQVSAWVSTWTFGASISLLPLLFLLFPDGRLPTPRWRWVVWLTGVELTTSFLAFGFLPADVSSGIHNPVALSSMKGILEPLRNIAIALQLVLMLAGLIAVVLRFRRSAGEERLQLKWFTFAAALAPMSIILWSVYFGAFGGTDPLIGSVIQLFTFVSVASFPVAIGLAIVKYRLYDIDLVINRTIVYGSLAVFITAIYIGIVVGTGELLGTRGTPNLLLSILATAVAAVAFQPMREALQRMANRLVYGKRASPYEILSQFSARASTTYGGDEVLPQMARVLAEGTAAARADVWVKVGSQLRPAAVWPRDASPLPPQSVFSDLMPQVRQVDRLVPVRHQGELLGALSVRKRGGESLLPMEEKLLSDLAVQAGLVLKNVGLTTELVARLDELRASRSRLVVAQDAERRRIERDLHDGLQQELVAMLAKVRIARNQATRDPATVDATLEELNREIREALKDLRELARGIHPPVLSDQGLVKAIEARVAHLPIEVAVEADGDLASVRYAEDVEGAAYFFVCEGLANVMKHAAATETTVRLSPSNGSLRVEVIDDGQGFDPTRVSRSGLSGLEDRIEAVGGTVSVVSRPGDGTRLIAFLPAGRTSPV
jgi:signal transduction histidine kinase